VNALPARDVEGGSKTVRGHQADDVVFYGRISGRCSDDEKEWMVFKGRPL
jgi:hypothetical protein